VLLFDRKIFRFKQLSQINGVFTIPNPKSLDMKLYLLTVSLFLVHVCTAQTYVTIIGTQHTPTDHTNSTDLYRVLDKIKPDVILMEQDSSTMSKIGEFLTNSIEIEPTAVKRVQRNYPVIIRPFDYKARNKFYQDNKIFEKEGRFFHTMDSIYNNKLMDSLSLNSYENFIKVNAILNTVLLGDLKEINSSTAQGLCKLRQDFNYVQTLNLICYRNKYMNKYMNFWKQDGDFWIFRNQTMVNNIIKYDCP
jgi:hypothetical protein